MADENEQMTWQEKADALKVLLKPNGMYVQIVYQSDDDHDCEPIPIPYELDHDKYPMVVEAPTGMNHPKFEWGVDHHGWHEAEAQAQGERIKTLEDTTKNLSTNVKQLQQDNTKTVQANEASTKQITNMAKLVVQSNANQAQMMSTINKMNAALTDLKKSLDTSSNQAQGGTK